MDRSPTGVMPDGFAVRVQVAAGAGRFGRGKLRDRTASGAVRPINQIRPGAVGGEDRPPDHTRAYFPPAGSPPAGWGRAGVEARWFVRVTHAYDRRTRFRA